MQAADGPALAGALHAWLDEPITRASLSAARAACAELAEILAREADLRDALAPSLLNVFLRTGYLKDYQLLKRFARRVERPELLDEVRGIVRTELPDVWVVEALQRGDRDDALACWYEHEAHERARLAAAALIAAFPDRVDVLVSGRLSVANHWIGRGARYRYRKAIRVLQRLRQELARRDEPLMWQLVIDDMITQHGHRAALLDEMEKAGLPTAPSSLPRG